MKLTKLQLKKLIKEELESVVEEQPELTGNLGQLLAKNIAATPAIQQKLEQLRGKDDLQKREFVAYFAQLLGVDLMSRDVSGVRAAQKKMGQEEV